MFDVVMMVMAWLFVVMAAALTVGLVTLVWVLVRSVMRDR